MEDKLNEDNRLANYSLLQNISDAVQKRAMSTEAGNVVLIAGAGTGNVVLIAGAGTVAVLVIIAFAAHWIQVTQRVISRHELSGDSNLSGRPLLNIRDLQRQQTEQDINGLHDEAKTRLLYWRGSKESINGNTYGVIPIFPPDKVAVEKVLVTPPTPKASPSFPKSSSSPSSPKSSSSPSSPKSSLSPSSPKSSSRPEQIELRLLSSSTEAPNDTLLKAAKIPNNRIKDILQEYQDNYLNVNATSIGSTIKYSQAISENILDEILFNLPVNYI